MNAHTTALRKTARPIATAPLVYERGCGPRRDPEAEVRRHLPLVRRIAWHIHGSVSAAMEVEDLIQTGLVALVEAMNSFEDRGEGRFEAYLATRLRGAMIDALRRQATLTRGAMRRRRAYRDAIATLTEALGRPPAEAELAGKLGVSIEKLRSDYATAEAIRFESLDEAYSDESPWFLSDAPDAFDALAEADQRAALIAAITALPEREAQVIQLYHVEELNLEEIGQVLGVGAARVCQIKASAHARLKKALQRRFA